MVRGQGIYAQQTLRPPLRAREQGDGIKARLILGRLRRRRLPDPHIPYRRRCSWPLESDRAGRQGHIENCGADEFYVSAWFKRFYHLIIRNLINKYPFGRHRQCLICWTGYWSLPWSRRSRHPIARRVWPMPAHGLSRSSAPEAISRGPTTMWSRARAPILYGSTGASSRSSWISRTKATRRSWTA